MSSIDDYIELVKAPWGRMFYDLLFEQLDIEQQQKQKILDFGSGLGKTADYYAAWHNVTAIEPDEEMIANRYKDNSYTQIHGGIEQVEGLNDNAFDIVICHNVLEYIEVKEPIIKQLFSVLKPGGLLSVVKHNRAGRVFHSAVFHNDPDKALSLLSPHTNDKHYYLGTQYIYTNDELVECVSQYGGEYIKTLGMRSFWALGQDNDVKYTDEWYKSMFILEKKVAEIDDYIQTAFFNHLLFKKP